jgi:hypothetical protein
MRDFVECGLCMLKLGSPILCAACCKNRKTIGDMQAKLAEVEAEREALISNAMERYTNPNPKLCRFALAMSAITDERNTRRASEAVRLEAEARAEAAEAAITRAYQMGLDATAESLEPSRLQVPDWTQYAHDKHRLANMVRALTPPADLVERAKETDQ